MFIFRCCIIFDRRNDGAYWSETQRVQEQIIWVNKSREKTKDDDTNDNNDKDNNDNDNANDNRKNNNNNNNNGNRKQIGCVFNE